MLLSLLQGLSQDHLDKEYSTPIHIMSFNCQASCLESHLIMIKGRGVWGNQATSRVDQGLLVVASSLPSIITFNPLLLPPSTKGCTYDQGA